MFKMKKINPTLVKVAILAIGLQEIGGGAASPALANIMQAFPEVSPTTVMQIASIPAITTMIMAPIYGMLTAYFRKRSLALFGMALFVVSGVLPTFIHTNIYVIIALRAVLGIAIGMLFPMAAGLITDFFDNRERAHMMGLLQTVGSFGGILFQMLGGYLATISWRYCFSAYFVSLICLILVFLFLPEPEKKDSDKKIENAAAEQERVKASRRIPKAAYPYYFLNFLFQLLIMVLVTNSSVMIVGENLGDAASAGLALSCMTGAAMLTGLVFGKIYGALRGFTFVFSFTAFTIGFATVFFAPNLLTVYLGSAFMGVGCCSTGAAVFQSISEVVPPAASAFALSVVVFFQGLGNFIEPYVFEFLLEVFHLNIGRQAFGLAAVIHLIAVIFILLWQLSKRKKEKAAVAVSR